MKKFIKFLSDLFSNSWFRLIFLCGCIVGIFALGGAFESPDTAGEKMLELITSGDILSIFLAAAVSLIIASFVFTARRILEESLKIEDDHHKIICMYHKHAKSEPPADINRCEKGGAFMYLKCVPDKRKAPKNPVSDVYSEAYKKRRADIESYMAGKLYLPSVDIFSNTVGGVSVRFEDSKEKFTLPAFVNENALQLLGAHGHSNVNNSITIRLSDIAYDGNELVLKTERSQYFDMLITNRCMDYALADAASVRKIYEFGDKVSDLADSKLGNQIGLNGLIFTSDGYLLVEKRGRKKTTWKDKFAQPISLAMKASDVEFNADGVIDGTPEGADTLFKKIIGKTIKKNFGLTSDLYDFSLSRNLLGIARDLLEGGKPNMYFYVTVKKTAKQLCELLECKAKRASELKGAPAPDGECLPSLTEDKLDSAFYFVPGNKIKTDYNYVWKIKAADMIRVKRKFAPRVSKAAEAFDGLGYRMKRSSGRCIKKECGEALLACLYYAEVARPRLEKEIALLSAPGGKE